MRDASVGFHCPECVAEGARSVRAPRTVAGGRPPSQVGAATLTLIGVNAVVFLITLLTGGPQSTVFEQGAMLSSTAVNSTGNVLTGVADGAYWRVITSAFLHQGYLHILFNMYALYI
ncbi:MAG TPA: rhomboid family intramembrane serine protease, partial [Aeromicrobium sp.]|nr:rhomboid family intramembrane serine protease [Aeromicrobium sp.]